jgi:predicted ATP-grasp superfamily ATP-dependent carboligase
VLLTDPFSRKTFDIANVLRRNKISFSICYDDSFLKNILIKCLYSENINKLRDDNFENDLNNIEDKYSNEELIFFPIEEINILKFYSFLKKFKTNIKYLLPKEETFNLVRDKGAFSKFCLEDNLNVPSEYNYDDLLKDKKLPCSLILKPKIGSGSIGIKFVNNFDELINLDINFDEYLIQEKLDNGKDILGGFFLCKEGEIISYYGHRRIRTYPEEGGVTVYSEVNYNEELKKEGAKLLEKLNWSGIAMVEFLFDNKSSSYKIIELNPRSWGSILLSEFSNANFIKNYVNLSMKKEIEKKEYKDKVFIRWIFPWDIISLINKRGKIKGFWNMDLKNTCYINFTYTSFFKSFLFLLVNIFDINKLKKLYSKILKK